MNSLNINWKQLDAEITDNDGDHFVQPLKEVVWPHYNHPHFMPVQDSLN